MTRRPRGVAAGHSSDARLQRCLITSLACTWLLLGAACATAPPQNIENLCAIFKEKPDWYDDAKDSEERWGTPIHVQMAIIRQESSFRFDARPPRTKLLGFIPWTRPSDAYGYAQVLESTWAWYEDETGRWYADRDDFGDAIDFVGWYTNRTQKMLGISKWDPYNQYLAYHEGHTGWKRKTWRGKRWLVQTARRVEHRAEEWGAQLRRCQDELEDGWWIF
ncbi:MAG TPA: transglycosylase SLT domain-containing protein [Woeseiaceae bacterium]|nr:transglycosylase SLT domain-containing protein [Woeseiaceae bacterium]